ncbi:DUF6701 domain-containing protein [Vibrio renipiscarius]|uniref:DUF6701 domain-containing protein n=1 Tax=Vibrio renipiscarius TaxID=1461322 RepID=UPI003550EE9E
MKNIWIVLVFALLNVSFASAEPKDKGYHLQGYVFEHYDFGGTPKDFHNANKGKGMAVLDRVAVRIEGNGVDQTVTTNGGGKFHFKHLPRGDYKITLPQPNQLRSERGSCRECRPVQVFPFVSEYYQFNVTVDGNTKDENIGISYSAVTNNSDSGVGSLRQFTMNTEQLKGGLGKASLQQEGHPAGYDNAIFMLAENERQITLSSPLELDDVFYTRIDATQYAEGASSLSIQSPNQSPEKEQNGIEIEDSQYLVIAGIDWLYFDHAIRMKDSQFVTIEGNRFAHTRGAAVRFFHNDDNNIERNVFFDTVNREDTPGEAAALYLQASERTSVVNNTFEKSGDDHLSPGAHKAHVSAIRVYYGHQNYLSRNQFRDTRGMAIDLRFDDHVGYITKNDGHYTWGSDIANNGIDYPTLERVSVGGVVSGRVVLDNMDSYNSTCQQDMTDVVIELYKAQGQFSHSTLEGTAYLGTCHLDAAGNVSSCYLDGSSFDGGDLITAITIDKCGNTSEMGPAVVAQGGTYDFGDAPNHDLGTGWEETRYPVTKEDEGARHAIVSDVCLMPEAGTSCLFHIDAENNGTPSRTATSDLTDDGVRVNGSGAAEMKVLLTDYLDHNGDAESVENTIIVNASKSGYVSIWLDKNQDGSWQGFERNSQFVSEKIVDRVAVQAGQNRLSDFHLSPYDVHGETFMRVRYATEKGDVEHFSGSAKDGEVEDYQVWIAAPSIEVAGCEAGLQNGSFEHFYTERTHNGWDTPESSVAGWSVQQIDPAADAQQYPISHRNNIEFNHYDHYVAQRPLDNSHNVAELNAYHPTMMYQDIVTTPGEKIRWSFDYSNRTKSAPRDDQQIALLFGAPNGNLVENQTIEGKDDWETYSGLYTVPQGQYVTRIAFKSLKPLDGASGNILDNAKFGCEIGYDFGDLPSRYREALNVGYHVVPNLYIGEEAPDVEREAISSDYAKGDDQHGFNDELTFSSPIMIMRNQSVEIEDVQVYNATGKPAMLNAWIDFDGNGRMDADEMAQPQRIASQGDSQRVTLNWNGHRDWSNNIGHTFMRISLAQANGSIREGEVEDHLVYITEQELTPQPGRCDGFIQVKEPQGSGRYQYAKWVANGGQLAIESINPALATDEIKVVGLNPLDGLTYGVGSDRRYGCTSGSRPRCEVHLFVADQSHNPAAEFIHLVPLRAAHDGVTIEDKNGSRYRFNANEIFDTQKMADNNNTRLSRPNAGDVSLDGRYLIVGRGSWHTLVRIDLATGVFDTIQLDIPSRQNTPWSADFAFNPQSGDSRYVYALAGDLRYLYRIALQDISNSVKAGSYTRFPLNLVLNSDDGGKAVWPQSFAGKLGAGGIGINKGGILFAMANGGLHDLNQNGRWEHVELITPTTALYSVDIAKQEIRFELRGLEESTTSNDAGGCAIHADYGDVPEVLEAGDPARHLGTSEWLKLGHHWSADLGPGHDGNADSDLSDDGVIIRDKTTGSEISLPNGSLLPLRSYAITLDKRGGGQATAWVNWGSDTQWRSVDLNKGIDVPLNAGSRGYLRVRYAETAVTSPHGEAPSGEVEDISFAIGNPIKGINVTAPGSPLTCEVAEYRILLDVEGGELSQDLNVDVRFDNPPSGCWFDASPFGRAEASSRTRCSGNSKTILFNKHGSLSRSIWVATDSELGPVTLTASAVDVGSDSDSAHFSKTGFKITPYQAPKYYRAGEEFSLQLTRKIALEDQASCAIDTDYQGNKVFTLRYNKAFEPVLGEVALQGKVLNPNGEKRTISFSNGVSEVLPASYSESGHLNVEADYQLPEGLLKSADISFTVNPYALVVKRNYSANDDKIENNGLQQPFVSAGTPFMVEVAAVEKGGAITRNFNASLASGKTGFDSSVVMPASQVSSAPLLSMPNGLNRVFSSGRLINRFEYDNVGAIRTRWAVDRYAGQSGLANFLDTKITHDSLNNDDQVGYFYPDYMLLSSQFTAPMKHADKPWTYYGKPDIALAFSLSAKSANHRDLSFYDASALSGAEQPLLADLHFDYGDSPQPSCGQPRLIDENNQPIDFEQLWNKGQWQISSQTAMFYRDIDCKQALRGISLQASVATSVPGRTIPIYPSRDMSVDLSGGPIPLGDSMDVLFGRLAINNASGPIDQLLPMAIHAEYWQGSGFITNEWDKWSEIGQGGIASLPEIEHIERYSAQDGQAVPVIMDGSMDAKSIASGQVTTHIGADAPGYAKVPLTFSDGAEKWLGYCWQIEAFAVVSNECRLQADYWQAPEAMATFGVSTGSNNVIYFMEKY